MWIPVDTRLHEHIKVQRLATRLKLPHDLVVGLLVRLWGLCSDFGDWTLEGDAVEISQHYRLPAGFLEQAAEVGFAKIGKEGITMLRTEALNETAERRRERASNAARARWDARNGEHDAQTCSTDARNAQPCSNAIEGYRDGKKKGSGRQASSPPPALEGAGGLSAASAIREAMASIGAAPPAVHPNPTQALLALKEAS